MSNHSHLLYKSDIMKKLQDLLTFWSELHSIQKQ